MTKRSTIKVKIIMHEINTFKELGPDAWLTFLILISILIVLAKDWYKSDFVMSVGLIALVIGIPLLSVGDSRFSIRSALSGFSNSGLLTVAALFIVAYGVKETGGLGMLMKIMLGKSRGNIKTLLRLMIPTAFVSAFLNNTPVVAMFTPVVKQWAKQNDISPSKLLIPLSYASILGGTCTLIGTSTNLVVSGLMTEHHMETLGMFELAKIGLPWALAGILFITVWGHRLLPDNKDLTNLFDKTKREYLTEMIVEPDCPLIGKSLKDAGLRQLKGLFLVHIERFDKILKAISPNETLKVADRLMFTGLVSTIVDLKAIKGLKAVEYTSNEHLNRNEELNLFEVVVSNTSPLVGRGIRESSFRRTYNAVVIAVHRSGQRISSKIGDIVLCAGDVLLLESESRFSSNWYNSTHFYLVSQVGDVSRVKHEKAPLAMGILFIMILLPTFKITSMLVSSWVAACLFIIFKIITVNTARRSVDLSVLITIASAFGIGKAMEVTGLASAISGTLISTVSNFGPLAVFAVIVIVTSVCTELITNNAAAALMFPIALNAASQLGTDPRPFMIGIAIAASASFATPLGYQTNMIVYGPGGYKFIDFFKIGLPMNLLMLVTSVGMASVLWDL